LPAHTLTLRREQCADGAPKINLAGTASVQWDQVVGAREVTFDSAPTDYDRDGRVWLLIEVRPRDPGATSTVVAPWQIKDLSMKIEADAVAPPASILLEMPTTKE